MDDFAQQEDQISNESSAGNTLNNGVEPTDTITKILKYQEEGYVFHGSEDPDIATLEPRLAKGIGSFNADTAVYASTNPQVCIMGIIRSRSSWCLGKNDRGSLTAEIPISWKPLVEKGHGTLYVLPSESFVSGNVEGWQVKSQVPVMPVDKVDVTFDDYLALGGKVAWKEKE